MTTAASFFAGIDQTDLMIRGVKARSPLFYRDVGLTLAVVTADLAAARALLPSGLVPLALPTGRALLGISCFEYRDTDIGPYNEVALGVAVRAEGARATGLGAVARSTLRQVYHAFICDLPVTTEIALHGGVDIFNYPKFLADIRFEGTPRARTCRVLDRETGALIYAFEADRFGTRPHPSVETPGVAPDVVTFVSYPIIGGVPHRATLRVNQQEHGTRRLRGGFRTTLGTHPRSALLAALLPGRTLQVTHVPRAQAILYAPEPLARRQA